MSTRDAFTAIADPTRREILDLLHKRGPLAAGDIASRFTKRSRPGISRHLRVLRECGVVKYHHQGKARVYNLDEKPLEKLRTGWLAKFGDMQRDSLNALRSRVESEE